MPDEMPDDLQVTRFGTFGLRFLDFVFAEVNVTRGGGRADRVSRKCLRNGDQSDVGRVASGPGGGARDAIANVRQPGAKHGGVEHYFGSCAMRAFAVAALVPSGAIFRYALNSSPASFNLPSFTSAMPS